VENLLGNLWIRVNEVGVIRGIRCSNCDCAEFEVSERATGERNNVALKIIMKVRKMCIFTGRLPTTFSLPY
jgi:hypothetical protein